MEFNHFSARNSFWSYIVDAPNIEAFERRVDRYWRDQDIVFNYEAAPTLDQSDRDGNDISPDSSEIDLDMHV